MRNTGKLPQIIVVIAVSDQVPAKLKCHSRGKEFQNGPGPLQLRPDLHGILVAVSGAKGAPSPRVHGARSETPRQHGVAYSARSVAVVMGAFSSYEPFSAALPAVSSSIARWRRPKRLRPSSTDVAERVVAGGVRSGWDHAAIQAGAARATVRSLQSVALPGAGVPQALRRASRPGRGLPDQWQVGPDRGAHGLSVQSGRGRHQDAEAHRVAHAVQSALCPASVLLDNGGGPGGEAQSPGDSGLHRGREPAAGAGSRPLLRLPRDRRAHGVQILPEHDHHRHSGPPGEPQRAASQPAAARSRAGSKGGRGAGASEDEVQGLRNPVRGGPHGLEACVDAQLCPAGELNPPFAFVRCCAGQTHGCVRMGMNGRSIQSFRGRSS
eukprot:scaffold831_cov268-Pinguiococcus_pyrenoidosus.AAC.10